MRLKIRLKDEMFNGAGQMHLSNLSKKINVNWEHVILWSWVNVMAGAYARGIYEYEDWY